MRTRPRHRRPRRRWLRSRRRFHPPQHRQRHSPLAPLASLSLRSQPGRRLLRDSSRFPARRPRFCFRDSGIRHTRVGAGVQRRAGACRRDFVRLFWKLKFHRRSFPIQISPPNGRVHFPSTRPLQPGLPSAADVHAIISDASGNPEIAETSRRSSLLPRAFHDGSGSRRNRKTGIDDAFGCQHSPIHCGLPCRVCRAAACGTGVGTSRRLMPTKSPVTRSACHRARGFLEIEMAVQDGSEIPISPDLVSGYDDQPEQDSSSLRLSLRSEFRIARRDSLGTGTQ